MRLPPQKPPTSFMVTSVVLLTVGGCLLVYLLLNEKYGLIGLAVGAFFLVDGVWGVWQYRKREEEYDRKLYEWTRDVQKEKDQESGTEDPE